MATVSESRSLAASAGGGTITDLPETLDDPGFDPVLYLVAVHAHTGSYDGLIRVWNR